MERMSLPSPVKMPLKIDQVYEVKEDPEVYIEKKILEAYEEEERGQSKINGKTYGIRSLERRCLVQA